jgi:hypothetical protein
MEQEMLDMTFRPFALAATVALIAALQGPALANAAKSLPAASGLTGDTVVSSNSDGDMNGSGCQGGR